MEWYIILLIILSSLITLNIITIFVVSFVCYKLTFFVDRSKPIDENEMPLGDDFSKYKEQILSDMNDAKKMEYKDYYITSFDGLKLHGMYFETVPGGPIEILFHGYRGSAFRDMSAGIKRAKAVGRNALLIEQRTCGKSEGKVITFGINEGDKIGLIAKHHVRILDPLQKFFFACQRIADQIAVFFKHSCLDIGIKDGRAVGNYDFHSTTPFGAL